jgi:hypothetical protein
MADDPLEPLTTTPTISTETARKRHTILTAARARVVEVIEAATMAITHDKA